MKVALLGPVYPYRGGIAHHTTLLDRALRRAGHEVLLVSFSRQYPRWLFPGQSDRDPSARPVHKANAHYWLDSLNPLTWLSTFRHIRRYRPDLLVLPWWTTFWFPVWMTFALLNRLFLQATLIFVCHNVLPHDASRTDRWAARLLLRRGDRFVVQSMAESRRLRALLPRLSKRRGQKIREVIRVVPHPNYNIFQRASAEQAMDRASARTRLNLPEHEFILLFFGLVREYKGLDILLRALPSVRQRLPQVKLVVAGEFWRDKQVYLDLMAELELEEHVLLHDRYIPNEEVSTYFAAADVLIAPYRTVTGSAVLQVAAAFDLPVIASQAVHVALQQADPQTAAGAPTTPQQLAENIVAFAKGDAGRALASLASVDARRVEASWELLVEAIVGAAAGDQ